RPPYGMRSCLIDKLSYLYELSQPAYLFAPEPIDDHLLNVGLRKFALLLLARMAFLAFRPG
ncbi:hypothetical protein, partial [Paraburkholderia youngii]|uniref:hypothetical protein n=1 Tax=Paraburkholderia youngii TaxID=2782701 RepID=UPI001C8419F3